MEKLVVIVKSQRGQFREMHNNNRGLISIQKPFCHDFRLGKYCVIVLVLVVLLMWLLLFECNEITVGTIDMLYRPQWQR